MPPRYALPQFTSVRAWLAPHSLRALTIASILLGLVACKSSGGPALSEIASPINATLEPNTVVLGAGDQVEVRFPFAPTWNHQAEITTDGSASFLAVGRMIVAGMTPGALNKALTDAYAQVLENAQLDVVVKSLGARNVYVMGEVTTPGQLELAADRRLTFVEALARAGGVRKESANLSHTLLLRWSAGTGRQLSWQIDARPEHWRGSVPLYLQPYDVIYVPNTTVDKVAVWVDNYIRRMIPFPYIIPPVR